MNCILSFQTNGELYAKGYNVDGILGVGIPYNEEYQGLGTYIGHSETISEEWMLVMKNVRDISLQENNVSLGYGSAFCLAITEDNKLYGWGCFGEEERDGERIKIA